MTGTNVLIVGAGPVGLTLAIDLAWRGIDVTIVRPTGIYGPGDRRLLKLFRAAIRRFQSSVGTRRSGYLTAAEASRLVTTP